MNSEYNVEYTRWWNCKESFTKYVKNYVKSKTDNTPSNFSGLLFYATDYEKSCNNKLDYQILYWGFNFYGNKLIEGDIFCTLLANEFQKNLGPNRLVTSNYDYNFLGRSCRTCIIRVRDIMASL